MRKHDGNRRTRLPRKREASSAENTEPAMRRKRQDDNAVQQLEEHRKRKERRKKAPEKRMEIKVKSREGSAGGNEMKIRVRFEKKELKEACRTVLGEIREMAGSTAEEILGMLEGIELEDMEEADGIDFESDEFEEAMDKAMDLDEELNGPAVYGEDGPCGDFAGCAGDDADCGKDGFLEFMAWDNAWDRDSDEFLAKVRERGAREMAKRRVMDGRMDPTVYEKYIASTLELIRKYELLMEEERREEKLTTENFLNDDRGAGGERTLTKKMLGAVAKQRRESPWYPDTVSGGEKAEDDDYNRYVEVVDIRRLEHLAWRLLEQRREEAMKTMTPFTEPFDTADLHLNRDGRTFRLEKE